MSYASKCSFKYHSGIEIIHSNSLLIDVVCIRITGNSLFHWDTRPACDLSHIGLLEIKLKPVGSQEIVDDIPKLLTSNLSRYMLSMCNIKLFIFAHTKELFFKSIRRTLETVSSNTMFQTIWDDNMKRIFDLSKSFIYVLMELQSSTLISLIHVIHLQDSIPICCCPKRWNYFHANWGTILTDINYKDTLS